MGVILALVFIGLVGLLVTMAEPAMAVMGEQVETLTQGMFKKSALVWAISVGVGLGAALGTFRLLYQIPIL